MKIDKPRNLALETLIRLDQKQGYSGDDLDKLFRNHSYLDPRDRAFITQLTNGVLRWKKWLDWVIDQFADSSIKKMDPLLLNILRIAVFQILFLDRVPESAAVNEAVNQAREKKKGAHITSFVNGILRNICRQKKNIGSPDRNKDITGYLSIRYSYPEWLVTKWRREMGIDTTEAILSAQNRFPDLNIRTNILKITRQDLIKCLQEEGMDAKPAAFSPEGIILKGITGRVDKLAPFLKGLFQVQDQAAQITSHLLGVKPGDRVLDLCAGYGGKSTHMAELMKGKGMIYTLDINLSRLINLVHNAARLGINKIQPLVADASRNIDTLFRRQFDKVVVDAPCSGLGVLARHPDAKWNRDEKDILRLSLLQGNIMDRAAILVKKTGRLLYITCTLSREENEDMVRAFLKNHKDMHLENLKNHIPDWGQDLIDDLGFYRTMPHIHHVDGFFAALFIKK